MLKDIKTWQERIEAPDHGPGIRSRDSAVEAEIAELRDYIKSREGANESVGAARAAFPTFFLHVDGVALTPGQVQSIHTQALAYAEALADVRIEEVRKGWFVWDGSYEKQPYDVWVKGCDVVLGCWPNAGKMNAIDGSGRQWNVTEVLAVRVSNFRDYPRPPKRVPK